jgi:diguanylate cyclase (GGDEF)-like protein
MVDHDPSWQESFENAVRGLPFRVEFAHSAWQAIELAQKGAHPIAVVEARMPGMDGLALVERIVRIRPETAFVLSTSSSEITLRVNHNIDGAIASLIRKPWDVAELRSVLQQAYDLHEMRVRLVGNSDRESSGALLIVEDNPGDVELILETLGCELGGDIATVSRLGDALELLHERQFDVVITDLTLPDARGLDAVIRLQASAPSAALIVCSGINDDALAVQVVQLGAQEFLLKNDINPRSLPRVIQFAKERKLAEMRLIGLAHFDQLTGLANRATFEYQAEQALVRAQRLQKRFALLYLDLDRFKPINDRLGHDAGDSLLQEVANRMSSVVREYDTVARLGGDEFGIVLSDIANRQEIEFVASRLNKIVGFPISLRGQSVETAASIGIAVYPDAGDNLAELLRQADRAMYVCKRSGRNGYVFAHAIEPSDSDAPYSWRSRSSIPPSLDSQDLPTMPQVPKYFIDK